MNDRKLFSEKMFDLGNLLIAGSLLGMVVGEWIKISWMLFCLVMGAVAYYFGYNVETEEDNL